MENNQKNLEEQYPAGRKVSGFINISAFKPVKLYLKHEDGTERNPAGPLYYQGANGESSRVLDEWIDLKEAKKIAKELDLPLEDF